ncbi:MAG: M3 family oligoendopeptidase [Candidatus Heimdallarchaeota archaeon]
MTTKWDLGFLYQGTNDPQIRTDLKRAEEIAQHLTEKHRGKIQNGEISSKDLLDFFQQVEEIYAILSRAGGFASLLFAQETSNDDFKSLDTEIQGLSVEIRNQLVWGELELGKMDDRIVEKYLLDPSLANYHHFIMVLRLSKPYMLEEKVEQALSWKRLVGVSAWYKFYSEYTSSFRFEMKINGVIKNLSPGEIRPLFQHPDPLVRERAFRTYYQKYADESIAITHAFNNIWRDHFQNKSLRNWPATMTVAHLRNQTDEEIVMRMIEVVRRNSQLVQKYYKVKAKLLGSGDKIKGSDLYAPIGKEVKYTWDEAKRKVLESYSDFDIEMGEMAKGIFDRNRIDSEVRKDKMTGAFCAGINPELDPVILMSFDETPESVMTLGHEMGHALHDLFAGQKQTKLNYSPPLVTAETASVFGEQLVIQELLKEFTDRDGKLKLLGRILEDAIVTISRQIMYIGFEKECHETGGTRSLSGKEMCDIWDKHVIQTYGEVVDFLPEQSWNWATIPHFITTRFYCYAYSFGMLFVLGLFQKYLEEGEVFIPSYKAVLKAGGSQFPLDLAASVGIDLSDEKFWQAGFDYLEKLLLEFQTLVDESI